MRNWIEVTAKTVEDAITEALIQLGSTRENVDIEVVEKETSGFLGLNKKPAKVRVALKETMQDKAVNFLEDVFKLMEIQSEITVEYNEEEEEYVVEGPRIEKMLGYTNLESEKGFSFFQNFLKDNGILEELEALGIQEGDTVRMYGLCFDYYK